MGGRRFCDADLFLGGVARQAPGGLELLAQAGFIIVEEEPIAAASEPAPAEAAESASAAAAAAAAQPAERVAVLPLLTDAEQAAAQLARVDAALRTLAPLLPAPPLPTVRA